VPTRPDNDEEIHSLHNITNQRTNHSTTRQTKPNCHHYQDHQFSNDGDDFHHVLWPWKIYTYFGWEWNEMKKRTTSNTKKYPIFLNLVLMPWRTADLRTTTIITDPQESLIWWYERKTFLLLGLSFSMWGGMVCACKEGESHSLTLVFWQEFAQVEYYPSFSSCSEASLGSKA